MNYPPQAFDHLNPLLTSSNLHKESFDDEFDYSLSATESNHSDTLHQSEAIKVLEINHEVECFSEYYQSIGGISSSMHAK